MTEQPNRTTPPPIKPTPHLRLPEPTVEHLPNGSTLHWINSGTIDVNMLSLVWQGGAIEAGNEAVANLTASMLREGAEGLTSAEIAEAIDFNGASLRCVATAHHTMLNVGTVNSLAPNFMPIVKRIIEQPTFPEEPLEALRDIEIKNFVVNQAKMQTVCHEALAPLLLGLDNPNARHLTLEKIEAVGREQLVDWHRRVFNANGCHAFLCGKLTESLLQQVRDLLLSLPSSRQACPLLIVPFEPQPPTLVFTERPEAKQNAIDMGLPCPSRSHPDYLPLRFAVTALGGYFGSRLNRNIREEKGYTYGIHAALFGSQEGSFMSIFAQADAAYIDAIIAESKIEMERLASEPMGHNELNRLKQFVSTSLLETVDTPFTIMDFYRTKYTVGMPDDYFERQTALARDITADQIMQMAKKYLHPDQLRISIAGKR